jgi:hypothetical protein
MGAATSSPAVLEAPAMTVAQQSPPQIQFPRILRTVGDLYQLWHHGLAMMPSIDECERQQARDSPCGAEAALLCTEGRRR